MSQAAILEVVICTYNNAAMLDGALARLAGQIGIENAHWSCLVVDNNCTDNTAHVVQRYIAEGKIPGLRIVSEPEQGLTPARLRGVRNSSAPWVAFVDDDCFLRPDWIANAVAFATSHPGSGAFGGKVALDWEVEPPSYVRAFTYCFAEQNHGDMAHQVPFLAGAGLIVNRSALTACGWSEGPLVADRVGKSLVSGGDVEIALRIAGSGRELWYVPQCELHHQIPVRRTTVHYLVAMNRNLGISQALADALVFEGSVSQWFSQATVNAAKQIAHLPRQAARAMRSEHLRTAMWIQTNFTLGQFLGVWRILRMSSSRRQELLGRARRPFNARIIAPETSRMSDFLPWKIVNVELRQPLPDLTADVGTGGLFVVFWCQGVPVGQLLLPASLLPINSAQLAVSAAQRVARAVGHGLMKHGYSAPPFFLSATARGPELAQVLKIARPLESFSHLARPDNALEDEFTAPSASVIICTRNRPEALRNCLSSLRSLSLQPREIIVVDNDPSSHLTAPAVAEFPEVRYVPEPRLGLSAARNTGVRNSTSEIIAFTDDDVIVHPAWIGAILGGFEDSKIMALTGAVLPAELATDAQFAFQNEAFAWELGFEGYEALDFDSNFFRNTTHLGVPVWRMGAGANMAFRREAFDRVGLFDERLGAGTSGCSEDSELWYRLLAKGYQCRYDPHAVVSHFHRSDWQGLSYQTYSYMRGHVAALLFQFDRYKHWGNLKRAFLILPLYFTKLALRALLKGLARFLVNSDEDQPSLVSPLHQKIRGMLAGYTYYLRHRHLPADPLGIAASENNNGLP